MRFDVRRAASLCPERKIEHFDSIDSTNAELVKRLKSGTASPGDVIVADAQSAGRGRHGKSFSSLPGGLYFSFVSKKNGEAPLTVAAGVAVASALTKFGFTPEIKWVNDVLLGGKKVCGILAEAVSGTDFCVIGIGINVLASAIPDELKDIATSLDRESGKIPPLEELVAAILDEYDKLETAGTLKTVAEYKKYLKMLGKKVTLVQTGEVCTASDVTERGELICIRDDGSITILNSGEISIKL